MGKKCQGVELVPETGEIIVHVVRIAGNAIEIVPIIYRTVINRYASQYKDSGEIHDKTCADIVIQLEKGVYGVWYVSKGKRMLTKSHLEQRHS